MSFLTHPGTPAEILADLISARRRVASVNDTGRVVGQDHHSARLTDHDVWLIHELREQGVTCRDIAIKFDVSIDTIKSISSGRRRTQTATGQRAGVRCTQPDK